MSWRKPGALGSLRFSFMSGVKKTSPCFEGERRSHGGGGPVGTGVSPRATWTHTLTLHFSVRSLALPEMKSESARWVVGDSTPQGQICNNACLLAGPGMDTLGLKEETEAKCLQFS